MHIWIQQNGYDKEIWVAHVANREIADLDKLIINTKTDSKYMVDSLS